jgi:hypothetical protein
LNQNAELHKTLIRRWLAEIGVSPTHKEVLPILGGTRGRDHNDRCFPAPRTPAQVLKDLEAMLLRQVNVQDYQAGARSGIITVRAIEETCGLLAIFDDMDRDFDSGSLDRFPDQENVRRVILHDQNMGITRGRLWIEGW